MWLLIVKISINYPVSPMKLFILFGWLESGFYSKNRYVELIDDSTYVFFVVIHSFWIFEDLEQVENGRQAQKKYLQNIFCLFYIVLTIVLISEVKGTK